MADATFDFTNLIVTLPNQSSVDVEREVYSAWKRAMKANDEPETGVYPAFSVSGGEPLTPGITAGSYFFLRNDLGWRIKPPEADVDITLNGNLAPTDSTLPITIPTTGPFTALITNLQPITQAVDDVLTETQIASYRGSVVVDTVSGVAGTTYPTGLFSQPVNNLADAVAILALVGGRTIIVEDATLTLDRNMVSYEFKGGVGERVNSIALNGFSVDQSTFSFLTLSGTGTGSVDVEVGRLDTVSGLTGSFRQVGLVNTVTVNATGPVVMAYCYSEVSGTGKPILDCGNANVDISVRGYNGGLDVTNFGHASATMTIDMNSGSPRLNASCTLGEIVIRGVGTLTDNSAGTTVNKTGLVDGLDVKLIKAMEAGNVTIAGDNPYVINVLDPDDNVTVIAQFEVSNDGLTRTRTI
jgi:hypothetical protein